MDTPTLSNDRAVALNPDVLTAEVVTDTNNNPSMSEALAASSDAGITPDKIRKHKALGTVGRYYNTNQPAAALAARIQADMDNTEETIKVCREFLDDPRCDGELRMSAAKAIAQLSGQKRQWSDLLLRVIESSGAPAADGSKKKRPGPLHKGPIHVHINKPVDPPAPSTNGSST